MEKALATKANWIKWDNDAVTNNEAEQDRAKENEIKKKKVAMKLSKNVQAQW